MCRRFWICCKLCFVVIKLCFLGKGLESYNQIGNKFLKYLQHDSDTDSLHRCDHNRDRELTTHSKKQDCHWMKREGCKLELQRLWWPWLPWEWQCRRKKRSIWMENMESPCTGIGHLILNKLKICVTYERWFYCFKS